MWEADGQQWRDAAVACVSARLSPARKRPMLERIPIGWNRDALWILLFAHVLVGKSVPTFPGHALARSTSRPEQ
jgi:hypothetical protein